MTAAGVKIGLYDRPGEGAFEVHGAILDAYLSQAGPLGALGYPIADEADDPVVGRVSEFQRRSIWWAKISQSTVIMTTGPVVARPSAGVRFRSFRNSGVGRTGRPLGPIDAFTYIQNAVELEFEIDSNIYATYQNLRPMQWAGPEATWIAYGTPIPPSWQLQSSSNGSGAVPFTRLGSFPVGVARFRAC
jgi:uncharacterized protein with LGFP repeats